MYESFGERLSSNFYDHEGVQSYDSQYSDQEKIAVMFRPHRPKQPRDSCLKHVRSRMSSRPNHVKYKSFKKAT